MREEFPGEAVTSDAELSAVLRANHQAVYHVSCTLRMGADDDPLAMRDSQLRVRGIEGLRAVDASVFPTLTALNPVGMVMTLTEKGASMLAEH